jgi:hypothetical protein
MDKYEINKELKDTYDIKSYYKCTIENVSNVFMTILCEWPPLVWYTIFVLFNLELLLG